MHVTGLLKKTIILICRNNMNFLYYFLKYWILRNQGLYVAACMQFTRNLLNEFTVVGVNWYLVGSQ